MSNTNTAISHENYTFEKKEETHLKLVDNNQSIKENQLKECRNEYKVTHDFLGNYGLNAKREGFFDGL